MFLSWQLCGVSVAEDVIWLLLTLIVYHPVARFIYAEMKGA